MNAYEATLHRNAFFEECELYDTLKTPVEPYLLTPQYTFDRYTHRVLCYDDCGTLVRILPRLCDELPVEIRSLCQDIVYWKRYMWHTTIMRSNFTQTSQGYKHKDYDNATVHIHD